MLTSDPLRHCLHTLHTEAMMHSVLSLDSFPLGTIFTRVSLYVRVLIPNHTWQMDDKPKTLSTVVELKVTKERASCLGIQRHFSF